MSGTLQSLHFQLYMYHVPTDITLIPVSTVFVLSSYMHACPENLILRLHYVPGGPGSPVS